LIRLILLFFVLAIIFGIFGFTGIAVGFAALAKVLFYVFLALLVLSLIGSVLRKG